MQWCRFVDYVAWCRSVQARHVLVSSGGRAVLSGLRTCLEFSSASHISGAPDDGGYKLLHSYPRHPTSLLNWASPEMLHQVNVKYQTRGFFLDRTFIVLTCFHLCFCTTFVVSNEQWLHTSQHALSG